MLFNKEMIHLFSDLVSRGQIRIKNIHDEPGKLYVEYEDVLATSTAEKDAEVLGEHLVKQKEEAELKPPKVETKKKPGPKPRSKSKKKKLARSPQAKQKLYGRILRAMTQSHPRTHKEIGEVVGLGEGGVFNAMKMLESRGMVRNVGSNTRFVWVKEPDAEKLNTVKAIEDETIKKMGEKERAKHVPSTTTTKNRGSIRFRPGQDEPVQA
jgi:ribosomal protein S25